MRTNAKHQDFQHLRSPEKTFPIKHSQLLDNSIPRVLFPKDWDTEIKGGVYIVENTTTPPTPWWGEGDIGQCHLEEKQKKGEVKKEQNTKEKGRKTNDKREIKVKRVK